MNKYYPINLLLKNKSCLVIGGGAVAERKVRRLLECGARVLVISPKSTQGLNGLAKKKKIIFKKRQINLKDLLGAYLVISATDDREINLLVSSYCRKRNILINIVDSPDECSFILPSIIRRGALTVSVSTDGISPALSRKIRRDLQERFGAEYARFLRIMREIRPAVLKKIKSLKIRKEFFKKALQPQIFDLLKKNKTRQAKVKLESNLKNVRT